MRQIVDVQKLRLLDVPDIPVVARTVECDLLIAGGGMGGCAAALAACRAGRTVVLTEETDWLGGQMTSQGVSALDEHRFIETFGGTGSYYELRNAIRDYYRRETRLAPAVAQQPSLNPGNGWVSRLCFEPAVGVRVLEELLAPHRAAGTLTVLLRHAAVSARVEGDEVRSATFRDLDGEAHVEVRARFVLDATELGDLLPLTGTEYVSGAESASETGEPHAHPEARTWCVQSFTYPFVLEHGDAPSEPLPEPRDYDLNRQRQPYTLSHLYNDERGLATYRMFETGHHAVGPFWTYRRLIDADGFEDPRYPHDLAMINWPGNDFRHGSIIDVPPDAALDALSRAKSLALGFCRWLQTEVARDEGGTGYPEFLLHRATMGSDDGLSKYPYIRESRRIRALRTTVEQDIAVEYQPGARAEFFGDSIGVGFYAIDIHPAEGEEKIPPAPARPFQIPLGALVPVRMRNLIPACKNIGTTHITNGAYRLHPVEWNIGESAALLACECLDRGLTPQDLAGDPETVRWLQLRAIRAGIPLYWWVDVPIGHRAFEASQLLAAWGMLVPEDAQSLEFRPDAVFPADLRRLLPERFRETLAHEPDTSRQSFVHAVLEELLREMGA